MNQLFSKILIVSSLLTGLTIGVFWGQAITRNQQQNNQKNKNVQNDLDREFNLLMTLVYASQLNGGITPEKEAMILNIYHNIGYANDDLSKIKSVITTYSHKQIDIRQVIQQYKDISDQKQRLLLFECLKLVTLADNSLSIEEKNFLQTIYNEFNPS